METTIPVVNLNYNLADVATSTASWFESQWLILAFSIAIPLSFFVAHRIKGLFQ